MVLILYIPYRMNETIDTCAEELCGVDSRFHRAGLKKLIWRKNGGFHCAVV
jgi:hypothetical protein